MTFFLDGLALAWDGPHITMNALLPLIAIENNALFPSWPGPGLGRSKYHN